MGSALDIAAAPLVFQAQLLLVKAGILLKAIVHSAVASQLPLMIAELLLPAQFYSLVVMAAGLKGEVVAFYGR